MSSPIHAYLHRAHVENPATTQQLHGCSVVKSQKTNQTVKGDAETSNDVLALLAFVAGSGELSNACLLSESQHEEPCEEVGGSCSPDTTLLLAVTQPLAAPTQFSQQGKELHFV